MFLFNKDVNDYILCFDLGISSLVGGGISAIGSLISSGIQYRNQSKLLAQQNEYNQQMADLAYQRDLEQWERENAYNTPAEQIERLKQAGLNPNLLYGNGSASTGNASSSPSYNAPMSEINRYNGDYGIQDAANGVSNAINQYVQTKLGQAQINNIQSNTALNNLRGISQQIANTSDSKKLKYLDELYMAQLNVLDSQSVNQFTQARLADEKAISERQYRDVQYNILQEKFTQLEFLNSLNPLQKEHLAARILNLNLQGDIRKYEKQIQQALVENGVNLKGGALERAVSQLINMLTDGNSYSAAEWLRAIGIGAIGAIGLK